ncbi:hypothetical protein C6341_g23803 [Phytophthora cactorum]|nr:hypothetical protein C6341_g23803 [Phytophthora cactorum]
MHCFLGVISCKNPDEHITKVSIGACPKPTTQPPHN